MALLWVMLDVYLHPRQYETLRFSPTALVGVSPLGPCFIGECREEEWNGFEITWEWRVPGGWESRYVVIPYAAALPVAGLSPGAYLLLWLLDRRARRVSELGNSSSSDPPRSASARDAA